MKANENLIGPQVAKPTIIETLDTMSMQELAPRNRVLAFGKTADTGDIAPNFYQVLSSLRRFNMHCWAGSALALVIGEIGPR